MAEGFKTWNSGDILNAADLNDYTSSQAVMRFANAAARDAALTAITVVEGMVAYLKDTNILTVNTDGTTSGWREMSPAETASIKDGAVTLAKLASNSVDSSKIVDGSIVNTDLSASAAIDLTKIATPAWTSYTNIILQGGGGVTRTDFYFKIGRLVTVRVLTTAIPTTGRTATNITGTLPLPAASANNTAIGSGYWYNGGTAQTTGLIAIQLSSTTVSFFSSADASLGLFSPAPNASDLLSYTITYESTS